MVQNRFRILLGLKMKGIHGVFWFLVLSFISTTESHDNQSGPLPGSFDLSVDKDENVDENEDVFEISLPKCGQPKIEPNINQKIVNGKPARPHSWPWQISLQKKNSAGMFEHYCGGSIISNDVVLTAAHCLESAELSDYLVIAGEHNQRVNDEPIQKKRIKRIIEHPSYFLNYTLEDIGILGCIMNDIAALILETPLTYQDSVSPVCLPNKNPDLNSFCYTTGWGSTHATGNPNLLNQIRLHILSNEKCLSVSCDGKIPKFDNEVCTRSQFGNGGLGGGDSGGPLVCLDGSVWYLHGIASYTFDYLSIFVRVYSFLDWIKETTGVVPRIIRAS